MFTGIVEEIGQVINCSQGADYNTLVIGGRRVLSDLAVGHSIAVNGVCLTVVDQTDETFTVQVIPETLQKTNLSTITTGSLVNLERAMSSEARFHGHIVQGHVETIGYVSNIVTNHGDVRMTLTMDSAWLRYCIPKGSIAVDGVSLTISDVSLGGLTVALIPHTLAQTILGKKQIGDAVNIETDVLARYLDRFLEMETEPEPWDADLERLRSWGFGES
ncbi:MAG: riboflavin synthase [Fidelibacterota bacterium]|nr:MAG: riboflavin synthase [Candidatus Neomarinimicrobiota bacterium]